jgi:hypothetical protein
MSDDVKEDAEQTALAPIGYGSPPVHSRFKKGQSGNPSGRAKGSQNLKTIFNKVLDEEISLREGSEVKRSRRRKRWCGEWLSELSRAISAI